MTAFHEIPVNATFQRPGDGSTVRWIKLDDSRATTWPMRTYAYQMARDYECISVQTEEERRQAAYDLDLKTRRAAERTALESFASKVLEVAALMGATCETRRNDADDFDPGAPRWFQAITLADDGSALGFSFDRHKGRIAIRGALPDRGTAGECTVAVERKAASIVADIKRKVYPTWRPALDKARQRMKEWAEADERKRKASESIARAASLPGSAIDATGVSGDGFDVKVWSDCAAVNVSNCTHAQAAAIARAIARILKPV